MDLDDLLSLEADIRLRADATDVGLRLDLALHKRVSAWASRVQVTAWVREGRATIGGRVVRRAGRPLLHGDDVRMVAPKNRQDLHEDHWDPDSIPLLARGPDWLIVDKPFGLRAHPAGGKVKRTLVVALMRRFGADAEAGGPWLCHRLDRDTSGLMLIGMTREAVVRFTTMFSQGVVRRFYVGRVHGQVPWALGDPDGWRDGAPTISLDTPLRLQTGAPHRVLADPQGQACLTRVQVRRVTAEHSDLSIEPITGRQHQIRVHLALAGHPLLGDPFYGPAPEAEAQAGATPPVMTLHACAIEVPRLPRVECRAAWE